MSAKEKSRAAVYYQANRERILVRQKAYRAANRESFLAWQREYRTNNPEKHRAAVRKSNRKYAGVVDAHGETKTGPCEICDTDGKLVLDHDHSTGIFRGWLCDPCNRGLGCFKDNLARLQRATTYLEKSNP